MKRLFDLVGALIALGLFWPLLFVIAIAVRFSSPGPLLYWSDRVGKNNVLFSMPKFRTMRRETPEVATHLLANSETYVTGIGGILRKTSLDELPQLFSIVMGHMSFVGPRPALFNQYDLIEQRTAFRVHSLIPGLTGWAQINGRDDLTIAEKVALDVEYMQRKTIFFDVKIIILTVVKVLRRDGITH